MTTGGAVQAMENADDWWRDSASRGLHYLAKSGRPFDAWDLVELGVPEPDDPHRWGGLFRTARQRGLIEVVGYRQSRRPNADGAVVRVWQGVPAVVTDEAA